MGIWNYREALLLIKHHKYIANSKSNRKNSKKSNRRSRKGYNKNSRKGYNKNSRRDSNNESMYLKRMISTN